MAALKEAHGREKEELEGKCKELESKLESQKTQHEKSLQALREEHARKADEETQRTSEVGGGSRTARLGFCCLLQTAAGGSGQRLAAALSQLFH